MINEEKLHVFIARAGICSRRKAENLISQGKVFVNGSKVTAMGVKVSTNDEIYVNGQKINRAKPLIYIALNKPVGYVSTVSDQFSRRTVIDLVCDIKERIYPVGRLDYATSGLLLLTNDGNFTYKITHPKHKIIKRYIARVIGEITLKEHKVFENGIDIDGFRTSPAKLRIIQTNEKSSLVEISISEGKNRQIRKMMDKINRPVISLKRISIGAVNLNNLPEGSWRNLEKNEIQYFLDD